MCASYHHLGLLMQNKKTATTKIELTREQKKNLNQSAINDGYHPSFVISKVRYSHGSNQWKGLTVGNKSVTLRNDWIETNISFPRPSWYIANLEPQQLNVQAQTLWVDLPVGNKKYVYDTAEQPSKESPYTKQYRKETQAINQYQFRYLQETYGDVCTLINVINWLHYIKDHISERLLAPYLNVTKWNEHVKELSQGKDTKKDTGFNVGHVMKLLRAKCGYTVIKHHNTDPIALKIDNPFVVRINPMHAIVIYNNMIFDANHQTMVVLNHKNMSTYSFNGILPIDKIHNTTCYEFRMEDINTKRNRKKRRICLEESFDKK